MNCQAYKRRCPKCEYHYGSYERAKLVCPKCGTARVPCGNQAVDGYRWCKVHGGPNPKNNFYGLGGQMPISGNNSQFQLTRLAGKYLEMQTDGRLLSNKASIEVIRKRITDLAERIDMNQAPDRLANIQKLWFEYKSKKGEPDEKLAMIALDEEFERAYHDYASWKQIFEAIDLDRKLVESEVKIIKDIHATLTAEDAYKLTAQLLAAIISTVQGTPEIPDHTKINFLKRIQYEFTRIVGEKLDPRHRGSSEQDSDAEGSELDRARVLDPGDEERPFAPGQDGPATLPT